MTTETLYTLKDACGELGAHYRLLRHLIDENGIVTRSVGKQTLLGQAEIDALRPLVRAWKERTRMSKPVRASTN